MKQRYDAWLHWSVTNRCNLDCDFCLYNQTPGGRTVKKEEIVKEIDIPALIKTLDGSGRVFRIGFTGGEPFLVPNFVEACREISKKHFVSMNTNATSKQIERFCNEIDPGRVVMIVASIHVVETEKHGLLDTAIDQVKQLISGGFQVNVSEVAYPPFASDVQRYKALLETHGIKLTFSDYHGIWNRKKYPEAYTNSEVKIFGLDRRTNSSKNRYHQFKTVCNAGYNFGIVENNGDILPCYQIKECAGNIYKEVSMREEMAVCPSLYCMCPFKTFDTYLFNKARKESSKKKDVISLFRENTAAPKNKAGAKKTCCLLASGFDSREPDSIGIDFGGYRLLRKHVRVVLPTLTDGMFDIILLECSDAVGDLARAVRNRIGDRSMTKLVVSAIKYTEDVRALFDKKEFARNISATVDAFITVSGKLRTKFSLITDKPVFYNPSLSSIFCSPKKNNRVMRKTALSFSRFFNGIAGKTGNTQTLDHRSYTQVRKDNNISKYIVRYSFPSHSKGKICIEEGPLFSHHRSGWDYAIRCLGNLHNRNGITFNSSLEHTFLWHEKTCLADNLIPYTRPWVGFFHNPPRMPEWFFPLNAPKDLIRKDSFQKSLSSCIGLFALSEHLGTLLRTETGKRVSVLCHPTEIPKIKFDYGSFLRNKDKRVYNIGWWLRKLNSIFLLPLDASTGYTKVRLLPFTSKDDPKRNAVDRLIEEEIRQFELRFNRDYYENTKNVEYLNHSEYDRALSYNICFLDLYDASANNAVIECIARCTPLLVNPIPPVVEYLGGAYPFYFDTLDEAAEKALDFKLIKETSDYLRSWHIRHKITGSYFLRSFTRSDVYRSIGPTYFR